jgi:cholesterol oxidase
VPDPIGVQFSETLKGFVSPGPWTGEPDLHEIGPYVTAERAGQRAGRAMSFTITVTIADMTQFKANRTDAAAEGTVNVAGLTGPEGAAAQNGVFNLYLDTEQFYERQMRYQLPFTGSDGQAYFLDGFKEVKDDGTFDVWAATSTLYVLVHRGTDASGEVVGVGVVHNHLMDFLHQLTTFRALGTTDDLAKAAAIEDFGKVFLGTLWKVFVQSRLQG